MSPSAVNYWYFIAQNLPQENALRFWGPDLKVNLIEKVQPTVKRVIGKMTIKIGDIK